MANVVSQIRSAIETQVKSVGSLTDADKLRYVFDIEANDKRVLENGWHVLPLDAVNAAGVNKFYTLDQSFEIILTKTAPRQQDDDQALTAIDDLYSLADDLFKDMLDTQLGLSFVLVVFDPSISAPELVLEGSAVALRIQLTVKYRQSVT